MCDQFYQVTSDDVVAYHKRRAEQLERKAEVAQGKLQMIPEEARDVCQLRDMDALSESAERHRIAATRVVLGRVFLVNDATLWDILVW